MTSSALPDGIEEVAAATGPCGEILPLRFRYRNWRGEVSNRTVVPQQVFVGRSQWHPQVQWMLLAHDLDRGSLRCFAMNDILEFYASEV